MKKIDLVKVIKEYIELSLSEIKDGTTNFSLGQMYAYVELLELLQSHSDADEQAEIGLNYSIEDIYPLK